jgi:Amt family ammonium transporter
MLDPQLAISGDSANAVTGIIITTNTQQQQDIGCHVCNMGTLRKADISMTLNGVLAGLVGVNWLCCSKAQLEQLLLD